MESIPYSTYIKEIDIKIYSDVPPDILFNLCQTDKYIKSICPDIWKIKIYELYPKLPIPIDYKNKLGELYFRISDSHVQLKDFATKHGYNDILEWLKLPINEINFLIEFQPNKSNGFQKAGERAKYRYHRLNIITNFLEDGIYPTQKSINIAMEMGDPHLINKLADYHLFPDQGSINIGYINGIYSNKLLENGLFPDQEAINQRAEKGYYFKDLANYDLFPDQDSINIGAENGKYAEELGRYGLFPDKESLEIGVKNGFGDDSMFYYLSEYGIYPSINIINDATKMGMYKLVEFIVDDLNMYPDQKIINYITEKGDSEIIELLANHDKYPDNDSINIAAKNGHFNTIAVLAKHGKFPDQQAVDFAYKMGYDDMIDLLEGYTNYPHK